MKRFNFTAQIYISMLSAIFLGLIFSVLGCGEHVEKVISPVGTIFLNLIRFIVCPLVLFSIIAGIVSMKDLRKVGILGIKTVLFFLITTMLSISLALLVTYAFRGLFPALSTSNLHFDKMEETSLSNVIISFFPSNFIVPFIEANMIQIIIMGVIFSIAIINSKEYSNTLIYGVNAINQFFICSLTFIMKFSPIGIFCLMCPVIACNGASFLGSLAAVVGVAYLCYALNILLIDAGSVKIFTGLSPLLFLKKMSATMAFAFSSSSSLGTLPLNLSTAKALGVPEENASFILPLGATINMNGTAIYHGVCAVFIATCYGINLTIGQIATIIMTSTLSAIGTAGVPGAGIIMLAMVLSSAGLPLDGIALVAGIDRLFDMGRTVANITGDTACAVCLSKRS